MNSDTRRFLTIVAGAIYGLWAGVGHYLFVSPENKVFKVVFAFFSLIIGVLVMIGMTKWMLRRQGKNKEDDEWFTGYGEIK